MKSSKTKIAGACAFAVLAIGLSLAAASFTFDVARAAEQWCVDIGSGTNACYPTLAACEAAHPGRACVKGAS
jgi:hypothetical protein